MIMQELKIELQQWGDDKGKYKGQIRYVGDKFDTSLALDHDTIDRILPVVAEALVTESKRLANDMVATVITTQKLIEHPSKDAKLEGA